MSISAPPHTQSRPPLTVYLAAPRGFCAGVDRAIQMVELALAKYRRPRLRASRDRTQPIRGRIPEGQRCRFCGGPSGRSTDRPTRDLFGTWGGKAVPAAAKARNIFVLDATCPLVSKVHIEAQRHHEPGLEIILIGHAGHPEVVGTMGQLPDGAVRLIETVAQARDYRPADAGRLAFVTQTTLSVDDTAEIVAVLKSRFPAIVGPPKEDICYATTNRQASVKAIASRISMPARRRQPAEFEFAPPCRGRAAGRV